MSKHSNFVAHPIAAATLPAITIGFDLSYKNAHWCSVDQDGTTAQRGCVRLTPGELRRRFGAMLPACIELEVSYQSAWVMAEQLGATLSQAPLHQANAIVLSSSAFIPVQQRPNPFSRAWLIPNRLHTVVRQSWIVLVIATPDGTCHIEVA